MRNFSAFVILILVFSVSIFCQSQNSKVYMYSPASISEPEKPCISKDERERIKKNNRESIKQLAASGKINPVRLNKIQSAYFEWPLKPSDDLTDPGYYFISAFVDHNSDWPNQLSDFMGGVRTYDREDGYNHQGTDIAPWPFAWYKMDYDQVEIISMAPGTIIGKVEGNYDRSCEAVESPWNAVYILHDNGATAWYGHMKNGSLTDKDVGARVETGDYLGVVGSSGQSTGPHIHLEIYDADENLIDPWEGPANNTVIESWWNNQPPYYDSKILKLATHSTWPVFPECPQQEIMNLKDEFFPGDTVFMVGYYRDRNKTQVSQYKVLTPEGLLYWGWDHTIPEGYDDYYAGSYWGYYIILPSNPALGTWEHNVFYEGVLYRHFFTVNSSPSEIEDPGELNTGYHLADNYPNPFNPATIINYSVQSDANQSAANILLEVYDVLGKKIKTLVNKKQSRGNYSITFEAGNLTSGVYYYTLRAGDFFETKKMILLK